MFDVKALIEYLDTKEFVSANEKYKFSLNEYDTNMKNNFKLGVYHLLGRMNRIDIACFIELNNLNFSINKGFDLLLHFYFNEQIDIKEQTRLINETVHYISLYCNDNNIKNSASAYNMSTKETKQSYEYYLVEIPLYEKEHLMSTENNQTVNHFHGDIIGSQIQQNVQNSSQSMTINEDFKQKEELSSFLTTLKENIDSIKFDKDKLLVMEQNIKTLENELQNANSKSSVINEGLATIRNVLEGTTGSLIASGLIYQMGFFFR